MELGHGYHGLDRHLKPGVGLLCCWANVFWPAESLCPAYADAQSRVLSHPFLDTPEQGDRGTNVFPVTASLWYQNSLWAAKTSYSLPTWMTFPYNWMLNTITSQLTQSNLAKPQGKRRPATSVCIITVLLKELLERIQQMLQRWLGSGTSHLWEELGLVSLENTERGPH